MKLPARIRETLDATGLPWTMERGTNHTKIKLSGRLVGIVTGGGKRSANPRTELNTIAQIKRAAREIAA